jgi:hypothetical protein
VEIQDEISERCFTQVDQVLSRFSWSNSRLNILSADRCLRLSLPDAGGYHGKDPRRGRIRFNVFAPTIGVVVIGARQKLVQNESPNRTAQGIKQ